MTLRRVTLTADLSAKLYTHVTAYKLARNQQADTAADHWSDDDVLYTALILGIEALDATTQHLLRRVPA